VGGTLKGKQPVGDVTRSPLHSAHCNLRNTPPAIVKTSLEIVDSDELVGVPEDSNWIQVVVFSLTREASRKRKQRLAANAAGAAAAASLPKDEDKADSNEDNDEMTAAAAAAAAAVVAENNKASEESVSWDVDLHGIGHLTYISPHDGVNAVRSRVLDRVPPHFRDLITSPSSRPAIVRDDGKATFLTTWDLPPWQEGDETDTSELYARVVKDLNKQEEITWAYPDHCDFYSSKLTCFILVEWCFTSHLTSFLLSCNPPRGASSNTSETCRTRGALLWGSKFQLQKPKGKLRRVAASMKAFASTVEIGDRRGPLKGDLIRAMLDATLQAMLRSAGARRLRKTLRRCPAGAKIAQRIASWTWDVTHE